jgi:hypothetical protein
MYYFDYEKVSQEARIPADKMEILRRMMREEFPKDEMMYELHLLRACMAIKEGLISIEEAIGEPESTV